MLVKISPQTYRYERKDLTTKPRYVKILSWRKDGREKDIK